MPRYLPTLFFTLGCLFFVPPCFSETSAPIRIGVTIPLSGGFVDWGDSIRRGIEMYAAKPGNRFSFDFQDETIGDAKLALTAYRKYRVDGTQYVIVGTMIGTKAVLPIAANDPVLLLSIGLVDEEELRQSTKIISLATQLSTESEYLGNYVTQQGFRRIAILHREDPFSEAFANSLKRTVQSEGAKVVLQEGVDPRETDFRSLLVRIKASNADALCFNVTQDRQVELVRQAKALGLKSALFSNYDFEASIALENEHLLADVQYSFPWNTAEDSVEKAEFDRQFVARYGPQSHPGANTYFIYDGLSLLDRALQQCKASDVACVNSFFKGLGSYRGLAGDVSFKSDGSNLRPYGIKHIAAGKFEWVTKGNSPHRPAISNNATRSANHSH